MTFSAKNTDPFRIWRRRRRAAFAAAGLPDRVLQDDRLLGHLLDYGDEPGGWNPSWISETEAAALLDLLDETAEGRASELARALRRKRAGVCPYEAFQRAPGRD